MVRNTVNSARFTQAIFLLALAYYSHDLRLHHLLFERPVGIHQWRQCDGASLALMFYQEGNSLFEPQIHNQLGGVGKAGGEFPVLYFFTSGLYHLFGPHEFMLRLVHFSCFLLGLMMFLHFSSGMFQWRFLAVIPSMLLLASPTLMFYALNFLPDTPAFGLSLAGSALFLGFLKDNKPIKWWASLAFFALAGLIKISMLLPWFAFMGIMFLNRFFALVEQGLNWRKLIQSAVVVLLPSLCWYLYIAHYNEVNNGAYFTTKVTPFWLIPDSEFQTITDRLFNDWMRLVFHHWFGNAIVGALLLFVVLHKRIDAFLKWSTVLMILGGLVYVPMFYIAFADHDYYFITLFIPILFLLTSVASALFSVLKTVPLRIALTVALATLVWKTSGDAVRKYKKTYSGWYRDWDLSDSFHDLEGFLESHGIGYDRKVFVSHDFSPNRSLYLMNRKGWTQLTGIYNADDLDRAIAQGAAYAIVPDTSFYSVMFLHDNIRDTIGYHHEIGVYSIGFSRWYKE